LTDLRDLEHDPAGGSATLDFSHRSRWMMLIVLSSSSRTPTIPNSLVARLMDSLAPGSYLVIAHPASDIKPAAIARETKAD